MTLRIESRWLGKTKRGFGDEFLPAQDEATLGELGIHVDQTCFTQALDRETNDLRETANLPACRLAEWLAWNWWRLRWEPSRRPAPPEPGWSQAHGMASIGGGWLWPNITIESDGSRIALIARPSEVVQTEPLYYKAEETGVIPSQAFEEGVGRFMVSVLDRLDGCSLGDADVHSIWHDLSLEREDPELSLYRRFEACLGHDPDEAPPELIERLIEEGHDLGLDAVSEVVAEDHQVVPKLQMAAREFGFDIFPDDGFRGFEASVRLPDEAPRHPGERGQVAAWRVGVEAARKLRQTEKLGESSISNPRLARLCGISEQVLSRSSVAGSLSFSLNTQDRGPGRLVLRSRSRYGRRFDVARLLGDRLLAGCEERLRPATRASTYRQKMQRAFAAEFLCPLRSLLDFLGEDFSEDRRQDAAERFKVSPLVVTTMLVYNRKLDREELPDPEARAA